MSKTLAEIAVGDRVWVGNGRNQRGILRSVTKLTPKQIVLDDDERFSRDTYRRIGVSGLYYRALTAIATPEECERFDAEQAEAVRESAARRVKREAREAKRRELRGLFGEHVNVEDHEHNEAGEWYVGMWLSEDGVRRLAKLLRDNHTPS